jgi:hypothetical protein
VDKSKAGDFGVQAPLRLHPSAPPLIQMGLGNSRSASAFLLVWVTCWFLRGGLMYRQSELQLQSLDGMDTSLSNTFLLLRTMTE